MKRVAIDTVTIYAGHGGSGGGIWTYTKQLLLHLDALAAQQNDLEFFCFTNNTFDITLANIRIIEVPTDTRKLLSRIKYLHFTLPSLCSKWNIHLLHRLTPEIPYFIDTPIVATLHDFMAEFYERAGRNTAAGIIDKLRSRYFFATKKFALNNSKAVITPSKAIRNEAVALYGGMPERIFVTELAAQAPPIGYKPKPTGSKPINLYTIAAFHLHKGHNKAIAIFETMRSRHKIDAYLNFRGNIQDQKAFDLIVNRINQSPCKDRIRIIPFNSGSTLADIYREADFMMLLSEYEGFGLPVLEAQSFGIPVICTDIDTFKEVAGDSVFFLDTSNTEKAADHLASLLMNPNLQEKLVNKGLENSLNYSWHNTAQKTINVYNNALDLKKHSKVIDVSTSKFSQ